MNNNLGRFIREMIPVLFGVLLALWINTWNEARKDRVYIENFNKALKVELKETDQEITEKIPQQQALADTLSKYVQNESLPLIQVIEKAGGVTGPVIKLNYWRALSNTKIELIEYSKLSTLTDIEEQKNLLIYKRNKLLDFIYANLTETGSNEKMILRIMVAEMINSQLNLQKDIQSLIDE